MPDGNIHKSILKNGNQIMNSTRILVSNSAVGSNNSPSISSSVLQNDNAFAPMGVNNGVPSHGQGYGYVPQFQPNLTYQLPKGTFVQSQPVPFGTYILYAPIPSTSTVDSNQYRLALPNLMQVTNQNNVSQNGNDQIAGNQVSTNQSTS